MIINRLYLVYIILLSVNVSSGRKSFVTRTVHDIHQIAVQHTHNLARDLRIAFGVIRASNDNQHVVYCKRGDQSPLVNGGSGNVSISSSATSTHSSSKPKATTTATSPWKLFQSYVCRIGAVGLVLYTIHSFLPSRSKGIISLTVGTFIRTRILHMVRFSQISSDLSFQDSLQGLWTILIKKLQYVL
jgi:hypothetical protein